MLNYRHFLILTGFLALAACDRTPAPERSEPAAIDVVSNSEALPAYEAQGIVVNLEGQTLTLDHDGSSAAGLKSGRDQFKVYADVIAEAPITSGSRVKFEFKKTPTGLELSKLEPRE